MSKPKPKPGNVAAHYLALEELIADTQEMLDRCRQHKDARAFARLAREQRHNLKLFFRELHRKPK